jgi:hypothetical protein
LEEMARRSTGLSKEIGITNRETKTSPERKDKDGMQQKVGKESCLPLPALNPTPSPLRILKRADRNYKDFYDGKKITSAWINAVIEAGQPGRVREDNIECDDEVVRAPFMGDWHQWCYPWVQPPHTSEFNSNAWAMKRFICKLTDEPRGWDMSDDEDSDDED